MFREVQVSVDVGEAIVFRFDPPLSITTLLVSNEAEEMLWEFIVAEFQPVEVLDGSFKVWPADEAPPEVLAMLAEIQARADRELAERGPSKPPLAAVTYGVLPPGYREESAPRQLAAGEYSVLAFGDQGQAHARFTIAGYTTT